jgi:hypothetical protein
MGLLLVVYAPPLGSTSLLKIKVAPPIAFAPGYFNVQLSVETNEDNRLLEVAVESSDFYRSSQIPLNGSGGPRLSMVQFGNLPAGDYEVSGILVGTRGPRAMVSLWARVVPGMGSRR